MCRKCVLGKSGLCALLVILTVTVQSQIIRWDGEAGDSLWSTPRNWLGDQLPGLTDTVLLDNTHYPGSYEVFLPGGEAGVQLSALHILPDSGHFIIVHLPPSSMAQPGLTVTGPGDGLIIGPGGQFINSSGIASGTSIRVADSLRILSGGKYVHRCLGAHASNIVGVLARSPDTRSGVFEFDVPTASYTLSLSNRIFGRLCLSSAAYGSPVTYSAGGTKAIHVRDNLVLDSAVILSLNFSDTFFVDGDLQVRGAELNLANSSRSLVLALAGNFLGDSASLVTETGVALPRVLLNGISEQVIHWAGALRQQVTLVLQNGAGAELTHPLRLPWQCELLQGALHASTENYLYLDSLCTVLADSVAAKGYVNGLLIKAGLGGSPYFRFPVGAGGRMRWLGIWNGKGTAGVEYHNQSANGLCGILATGIHHVSSLEYWTLLPGIGFDGLARAELSFTDPNSGGVTSLSNLLVSVLDSAKQEWKSVGQSAVSGLPGSAGSVTGQELMLAYPAPRYLALASNSSANPLPLASLSFAAGLLRNGLWASWQSPGYATVSRYELEIDKEGGGFRLAQQILPNSSGHYRIWLDGPFTAAIQIRLRMVRPDGSSFTSPVKYLSPLARPLPDWEIRSVTADGYVRVRYFGNEEAGGRFILFNYLGQQVKVVNMDTQRGQGELLIPVGDLPAGVYLLYGWLGRRPATSIRFIKP